MHTWDIKYVSQVQVEALAACTSTVSVLAYYKSGRRRNRWMLLSAITLGLTAESKYPYCLAGVAMAADWLWSEREARGMEAGGGRGGRSMLPLFALWGLVALLSFFAADPYLWPDPFNRLRQSVLYHAGYAQSIGVTEANFPMWQPLVWLMGSVPWHPGVFLVALDMPITLLAAWGLPQLWRKQRVFALWLALTLAFLFVWNTKWPQYVVMLTVPLSLAAAHALRENIGAPLVRWLRSLNLLRVGFRDARLARRETKFALPWLVPGTVVLALLTVFPLLFQGAMSLTDFNALSIRHGMTGGVLSEAWRGLTGQVEPVQMVVGGNGRVTVNVVKTDRGEPHAVPLASSGLSTKEVHYAGPAVLAGLASGLAADLLVFEILWTVLAVGTQAALGIALALVLNQHGLRGKKWWRTVLILPWAIPEFVGGLVWLHVFEPTKGWVALALGTRFPWQGNPQVALLVLLVAALWMGFPLMMLAAGAGLGQVPKEVYDATAVDGASRWEQFRYVTFPLLLPLLAPALILRAIFSFNQFYLFYVLGSAYPLMSFATLSFYLFDATRGLGGQFAVSAAINVFTVVVLLLLLLAFNRRARLAEGVTYA